VTRGQRFSLEANLFFVRALAGFLFVMWLASPALADDKPGRSVRFQWTPDAGGVLANFSFRDLIDSEIQLKLTRGLPTIIVFTGLIYRQGEKHPISNTLQTCRVTWHVWEEMYRIEITRSNSELPQLHWSPTVNGVLRRCAEADGLLIADSSQLSQGTPISIRGKLQINPISPEVFAKIKRWISRPSRTRTPSTGSELFSTFTGIFMQRVGDAERTIEILTQVAVPAAPVKPPAR
jgi:hypothetical protein